MARDLNLKSIQKRMKKKPVGQRIYGFFAGAVKMLDLKQIEDIERIVIEDHADVLEFLKDAKERHHELNK